ncbi:hypothetical protein Tco_0076336, partial [Tanacetum coccineum]
AELRIQDNSNESSISKLVLNVVPTTNKTNTSLQELELLFSPIQPTLNVEPTLELTIPPTDVNAEKNNNDQAEDVEFKSYEFINPFAPLGIEATESSFRNVDTSNIHTLYQRHRSNYHWTKYYPLEPVCGNPSKRVQTRRQLATNPEMCMFALTMSTAEQKNIKEAMTDHAWIKAMQEELHQF